MCESSELSLEQVCLKLEQHRRRSLSPLDYHKTIPSEKGHKILHKIRSCGSINTWRVAEKCRSSPKTGVGKPSLDDERHFSKARTSSNNAFAYELALWTKNSNIMQRRFVAERAHGS
jgi:hypothetical protein